MKTLRNIECVPHFIIPSQEPGDSQARDHYFYFVSGRRQVQQLKFRKLSNLLNVSANLRVVTRLKAVNPTHFLCARYPHPKEAD